MGSPILPRNIHDPTGQDKRERAAIKDFDRRVNFVGKETLRILGEQSYTVATLNTSQIPSAFKKHRAMLEQFNREDMAEYRANRGPVEDCDLPLQINMDMQRDREIVANNAVKYVFNATTYQFQLDQAILLNINSEIQRISELIMLEGGERNLWFTTAYVEPAYQQGTAMAATNIAIQSETYKLTKPTLDSILFSDPYVRRIGALKAREFEEMKGFTYRMRTDLAQTLTRGMIAGKNPRDIAKDIEARIGVNKSRANLIARTEITMAFKNARMDEAERANIDLGIKTRQAHISAFSPTTRIEHAKRHGTIHTIQEQREWWSLSKNACNCKCSTIEVLVDDDGKPLSKGLMDRLLRNKPKFIKELEGS